MSSNALSHRPSFALPDCARSVGAPCSEAGDSVCSSVYRREISEERISELSAKLTQGGRPVPKWFTHLAKHHISSACDTPTLRNQRSGSSHRESTGAADSVEDLWGIAGVQSSKLRTSGSNHRRGVKSVYYAKSDYGGPTTSVPSLYLIGSHKRSAPPPPNNWPKGEQQSGPLQTDIKQGVVAVSSEGGKSRTLSNRRATTGSQRKIPNVEASPFPKIGENQSLPPDSYLPPTAEVLAAGGFNEAVDASDAVRVLARLQTDVPPHYIPSSSHSLETQTEDGVLTSSRRKSQTSRRRPPELPLQPLRRPSQGSTALSATWRPPSNAALPIITSLPPSNFAAAQPRPQADLRDPKQSQHPTTESTADSPTGTATRTAISQEVTEVDVHNTEGQAEIHDGLEAKREESCDTQADSKDDGRYETCAQLTTDANIAAEFNAHTFALTDDPDTSNGIYATSDSVAGALTFGEGLLLPDTRFTENDSAVLAAGDTIGQGGTTSGTPHRDGRDIVKIEQGEDEVMRQYAQHDRTTEHFSKGFSHSGAPDYARPAVRLEGAVPNSIGAQTGGSTSSRAPTLDAPSSQSRSPFHENPSDELYTEYHISRRGSSSGADPRHASANPKDFYAPHGPNAPYDQDALPVPITNKLQMVDMHRRDGAPPPLPQQPVVAASIVASPWTPAQPETSSVGESASRRSSQGSALGLQQEGVGSVEARHTSPYCFAEGAPEIPAHSSEASSVMPHSNTVWQQRRISSPTRARPDYPQPPPLAVSSVETASLLNVQDESARADNIRDTRHPHSQGASDAGSSDTSMTPHQQSQPIVRPQSRPQSPPLMRQKPRSSEVQPQPLYQAGPPPPHVHSYPAAPLPSRPLPSQQQSVHHRPPPSWSQPQEPRGPPSNLSAVHSPVQRSIDFTSAPTDPSALDIKRFDSSQGNNQPELESMGAHSAIITESQPEHSQLQMQPQWGREPTQEQQQQQFKHQLHQQQPQRGYPQQVQQAQSEQQLRPQQSQYEQEAQYEHYQQQAQSEHHPQEQETLYEHQQARQQQEPPTPYELQVRHYESDTLQQQPPLARQQPPPFEQHHQHQQQRHYEYQQAQQEQHRQEYEGQQHSQFDPPQQSLYVQQHPQELGDQSVEPPWHGSDQRLQSDLAEPPTSYLEKSSSPTDRHGVGPQTTSLSQSAVGPRSLSVTTATFDMADPPVTASTVLSGELPNAEEHFLESPQVQLRMEGPGETDHCKDEGVAVPSPVVVPSNPAPPSTNGSSANLEYVPPPAPIVAPVSDSFSKVYKVLGPPPAEADDASSRIWNSVTALERMLTSFLEAQNSLIETMTRRRPNDDEQRAAEAAADLEKSAAAMRSYKASINDIYLKAGKCAAEIAADLDSDKEDTEKLLQECATQNSTRRPLAWGILKEPEVLNSLSKGFEEPKCLREAEGQREEDITEEAVVLDSPQELDSSCLPQTLLEEFRRELQSGTEDFKEDDFISKERITFIAESVQTVPMSSPSPPALISENLPVSSSSPSPVHQSSSNVTHSMPIQYPFPPASTSPLQVEPPSSPDPSSVEATPSPPATPPAMHHGSYDIHQIPFDHSAHHQASSQSASSQPPLSQSPSLERAAPSFDASCAPQPLQPLTEEPIAIVTAPFESEPPLGGASPVPAQSRQSLTSSSPLASALAPLVEKATQPPIAKAIATLARKVPSPAAWFDGSGDDDENQGDDWMRGGRRSSEKSQQSTHSQRQKSSMGPYWMTAANTTTGPANYSESSGGSGGSKKSGESTAFSTVRDGLQSLVNGWTRSSPPRPEQPGQQQTQNAWSHGLAASSTKQPPFTQKQGASTGHWGIEQRTGSQEEVKPMAGPLSSQAEANLHTREGERDSTPVHHLKSGPQQSTATPPAASPPPLLRKDLAALFDDDDGEDFESLLKGGMPSAHGLGGQFNAGALVGGNMSQWG